jgi:hypothetical protein
MCTLSERAFDSVLFDRRSDFLDDDFRLEPGNLYSATADTRTGKAITKLILSDGMVCVLLGAVLAAKSRPPVAVATPFILRFIGEDALEDKYKRFTGVVIRQMIDHIGGKLRRTGVPIRTKGSGYSSGATYTFGPLS